MIGDDGRVRVVDFGLACEAEDPDGPSTKHQSRRHAQLHGARAAVRRADHRRHRPVWVLRRAGGGARETCGGRGPRDAAALAAGGHRARLARRMPPTASVDDGAAARARRAIRCWCAGGASRRRPWWSRAWRRFAAGRSSLRQPAAPRATRAGRAPGGRVGRGRARGGAGAARRDGRLRPLAAATAGTAASPSRQPVDGRLPRRLPRARRAVRCAGRWPHGLPRTRPGRAYRPRRRGQDHRREIATNLVHASQALPDPDGCGDLGIAARERGAPPTAIAGARSGYSRSHRGGARADRGRTAQEARAIAEQAVAEARGLGYRPAARRVAAAPGRPTRPWRMDDRVRGHRTADRSVYIGLQVPAINRLPLKRGRGARGRRSIGRRARSLSLSCEVSRGGGREQVGLAGSRALLSTTWVRSR